MGYFWPSRAILGYLCYFGSFLVVMGLDSKIKISLGHSTQALWVIMERY